MDINLIQLLATLVFALLLSTIQSAINIYKLRPLVFETEFNINTTFILMIKVCDVLLLFMAFFAIYNVISDRENIKYTIQALAIIIPRIYFRKKAEGQRYLLIKIDNFFTQRRVKQFKACPCCSDSRLFYRKVLNSDEVCYFLVNKYNTLVYLGFYLNSRDLALPFLNEPFYKALSIVYPLLKESYSDVTVLNDKHYQLDSSLYCAHCHKEVSKYPIELGMVDFKQKNKSK